jgi:hypothetical protein
MHNLFQFCNIFTFNLSFLCKFFIGHCPKLSQTFILFSFLNDVYANFAGNWSKASSSFHTSNITRYIVLFASMFMLNKWNSIKVLCSRSYSRDWFFPENKKCLTFIEFLLIFVNNSDVYCYINMMFFKEHYLNYCSNKNIEVFDWEM